MAVYTKLSDSEIARLIEPFGLGHVIAAQGVAAGVENTTYFIITVDGAGRHPKKTSEYALTISESLNESDIQFVATLTSLLYQQHLPVPAPVADQLGRLFFFVQGKPALLTPKMAGTHPLRPSPAQCQAVGAALGRLHRITRATELNHKSHRSLEWVMATAKVLSDRLSLTDQNLLSHCTAELSEFVSAHKHLPQAIIHGDLFRDNTLFDGDRLVAIIDFFSAGTGFLMLDLAIAANDWCMQPNHQFEPSLLTALICGYNAIRPADIEEQQLWPQFLQFGALRFWVSRLAEQLLATNPRPSKNPEEYRERLLQHRQNPSNWPIGS